MTTSKSFEAVRASPLAAELNDEECAALGELAILRTLVDGEILIKEGEIGDELHVIVSGSIAVTRDAGNGDWITLHVLRARDLAGELGFLDNLGHSATLRAFGATEVFSLKRERFETLLATHPRAVYLVMRAIVREVHGILRRMNAQYVELSNYISKQHGRY